MTDPHVLARRDDPATSHAAAVDVHRVRGSHRERVLAVIRAAGSAGLTYAEAADRAGVDQAWRRVSDLKNQGLIKPSGVERLLPSGRYGTVWVAVR